MREATTTPADGSSRPQNLRSAASKICVGIANIEDAAKEELGYVKSILTAIELMANADSLRHRLDIASLARCAHWIADNLESNVDHFGGEIVEASREVH